MASANASNLSNRKQVKHGKNSFSNAAKRKELKSKDRSAYSKLFAFSLIVLSLIYILIPDEKLLFATRSVFNYLEQFKVLSPHFKSADTKEKYLATIDQHFPGMNMHEVNCSYNGYKDEMKMGLAPTRCGTIISDTIVTIPEALRLRRMAAKLTAKIGTSSARERESLNLKWVELYNVFRRGPPEGHITKKDYEILVKTSEAAKYAVSVMFGVPSDKLYFSHICEFTRYKPMIKFSEFLHIDKIRAPTLLITAIIWLSTVEDDFLGGNLEFLTGGPEPFTPLLIEPKLGRFAAWTSSYENPHGVREVYVGERLALVLGFTIYEDSGYKTLEDMFDVAIATYETV